MYHYPDIGHGIKAEYPNPDWSYAFQLTQVCCFVLNTLYDSSIYVSICMHLSICIQYVLIFMYLSILYPCISPLMLLFRILFSIFNKQALQNIMG